jgi:hypothetical protein
MAASILLYAAASGLCALSTQCFDLAIYRFLWDSPSAVNAVSVLYWLPNAGHKERNYSRSA